MKTDVARFVENRHCLMRMAIRSLRDSARIAVRIYSLWNEAIKAAQVTCAVFMRINHSKMFYPHLMEFSMPFQSCSFSSFLFMLP